MFVGMAVAFTAEGAMTMEFFPANAVVFARLPRAEEIKELFEALANGEPVAWTLVVGLVAVIVLTVVVAVCRRRFQKTPTTVDPAEIAATWKKQCQGRLLVLPVLVVPMILGTLVCLALDNTAGGVVLVSCVLLGAFAGVVMLMLSTTCPACKAFTGPDWRPASCPKCGVALEETGRPKPSQETSPAASEPGPDAGDQNKPA
jgi:hypothetical protein